MTPRRKKLLSIGVFLMFTSILTLAVVEWFARAWIIPRDFLFFKVSKDHFPYFRLADRFDSDGIRIRNGRREPSPPKGFRLKVAFVGDSNTFGLGVNDAETYQALLQQKLWKWDTYNFGVPGYGILEVGAVVDQMAHQQYDVVVYNFNYNDPMVAMFLYLPLMGDSSTRLTAMDQYEGMYGAAKLFAKDHWKTLFVFPSILSAVAAVKRIGGEGLLSRSASPQKGNCEALHRAATETADGFIKPYHVMEKVYSDPKVIFKMEAQLRKMRKKVESYGGKFVVFPHYDFPIMDKMHSLRAPVIDAIHRSGAMGIDPYEFYQKHFKECGFYSDYAHLGPKGNQYIAQFLKQSLTMLK